MSPFVGKRGTGFSDGGDLLDSKNFGGGGDSGNHTFKKKRGKLSIGKSEKLSGTFSENP